MLLVFYTKIYTSNCENNEIDLINNDFDEGIEL